MSDGDQPKRDAAAEDRFTLLEARHVDALTEAVRALNANVTRLVAISQSQLKAVTTLTTSVCELAELLRPKDPTSSGHDKTPSGMRRTVKKG